MSKAESSDARARRTREPDAAASGAFDFARLDKAVVSLIEQQRRLRRENQDLHEAVAARDEQLIDLNQRRSDTMKRLDELIARVAEFESRAAKEES